MSGALAEALVAAQRRAIGALESALIEALKAGTYDPTEWHVPF